MKEETLQTVDINRIKNFAGLTDEHAVGNDFLIGEIKGDGSGNTNLLLPLLRYPIRFDGYIIAFIKNGHFHLDLNLRSYDLHQRSLLMVAPGNIVKLSPQLGAELDNSELFFVLVSRTFMSSIRFDFNKVFKDSVRMMSNPCVTISGSDLALAEEYYAITRKILTSRRSNKLDIVGSLFTSYLLFQVDLWSSRRGEIDYGEASRSSARTNQVFQQFISLVTKYHTSERGMAFYADKLCLTPKYLSKLVKQATGRSAPDWIDSFVILEAKNQLRYSDKTIKEIVFSLNFPNQSVFYKFFKTHTGKTPSEYRKG